MCGHGVVFLRLWSGALTNSSRGLYDMQELLFESYNCTHRTRPRIDLWKPLYGIALPRAWSPVCTLSSWLWHSTFCWRGYGLLVRLQESSLASQESLTSLFLCSFLAHMKRWDIGVMLGWRLHPRRPRPLYIFVHIFVQIFVAIHKITNVNFLEIFDTFIKKSLRSRNLFVWIPFLVTLND